MDEYPSNSKGLGNAKAQAPREEPRKVNRIVTGEVVRRKTPLGRRVKNFFGGEEQSIWGFMVDDVLIPATRDMVAEALIGSVERVFGGHTPRGLRTRIKGGITPYNQYSMSSNRGRRDEPRQISKRARGNHAFDEIVLESRAEAMEILGQMTVLTEKYDGVSIADFYEMCGISGNWAEKKWGWTNLEGSSIQRVRGGGYILNLPRPEQLD